MQATLNRRRQTTLASKSTPSTLSRSVPSASSAPPSDTLAALGAACLCVATSLGGVAAPLPSASSANASSSAAKLILSVSTIALFRNRLERKANAMSQIPCNPQAPPMDLKTRIFSLSAKHYLDQTKTIPPAAQTDFASAILILLASAIRESIAKFQSDNQRVFEPADTDALLLIVVTLYLVTLKEAIGAENTHANPALSHPFFKYGSDPRDSSFSFLRHHLVKFLSTIDGDSSSAVVSENSVLFEYMRSISSIQDGQFVNLCNQAKAMAKKRVSEAVVYSAISDYVDALKAASDAELVADFKVGKWEDWKSDEIHVAKGMMNMYKAVNPEIQRIHVPKEQLDLLLPPTRHEYYKILLALCLQKDLKRTPNGGGVVSFELSKLSVQLLNECAQRWRISKGWRELAVLENVVAAYGEEVYHLADIKKQVDKCMDMMGVNGSPRKSEDEYYYTCLKRLHMYIKSRLISFPELCLKGNPSFAQAQMAAMVGLYRRVYETDSFWEHFGRERGDVVADVEATITDVLVERYGASPAVVRMDLDNLKTVLELTKWVNQEVNMFNKCFPTPIYDKIEIGFLVQDLYIKRNFRFVLETMRFNFQSDADTLVFGPDGLYECVSRLFETVDVARVFRKGEEPDIEEFFRNFIEAWVQRMDGEWKEWAGRVIENDDFLPILVPTTMYSSSIKDMFGFFDNGLGFMKKLKASAQNMKRREALMISFLAMMGRSIVHFSDETFSLFQKTSMQTNVWMPKQCIQLNNIVGAIRELQRVFVDLDIGAAVATGAGGDAGSGGVGKPKINPMAKRTDRVAGKVKLVVTVVRGVGLPVLDRFSSDPFVGVILDGVLPPKVVTAVERKNLNPVWNQTFEFEVPATHPTKFYFAVYDEDRFEKYRYMASCLPDDAIVSDDPELCDFLTHERVLQLEQGTGNPDEVGPKAGVLVVRVMRDGEIQDREFWVAKSMQSLTFTAEKMVRVFTEKIVRFAELEWNKISAQFKPKLFGSSGSGSNRPSTPQQPATLIDESKVESALLPLLKHLDANLTVLNQNLDRPLVDRFLCDAYPFLSENNPVAAIVSPVGQDKPAIAHLQKHDLDRPSQLPLVIWNKLVTRLKSSVETIRSTAVDPDALNESEKRQVAALELVLEYLKAFFYCDLDGKCCGFSLKVLEGGEYREVRKLVKELLV
ncbi:hypothetical protein HDU98_010960 [Podochytrium sp. JEL0797]|nr:hypothetical protein HDU98_010960 [Podochytrium sp. JEL0797]